MQRLIEGSFHLVRVALFLFGFPGTLECAVMGEEIKNRATRCVRTRQIDHKRKGSLA
jgi:hypothetical protein